MHFLVELTLRGPLADEDLQAQRAFLKRLTEEARLMLAAIVPDRPGTGMAILQAGSLDEARACYAQAPVVTRDLVEWSIREIKLTAGLANGLATPTA